MIGDISMYDDETGTPAQAHTLNLNEELGSLKDVINEFSVLAALPWHLERLIRVYDSSLGSRKKVQSDEIKQLSIILPNYLQDSRFFDKTDIIDWAVLNAYKDNKTSELLGPQRPFEVEFARDIMQQESDSFDCGTYIAAFAEFLSDEMKYGTDKAKAGYVSENDDPTRLKGVFIPLTDDELINVE
ncbi:hypothetical protein KY285_021151 [Solanum tuberosum]|nr:hypothetical protein KY285_021151 [Solanum tuberosum]